MFLVSNELLNTNWPTATKFGKLQCFKRSVVGVWRSIGHPSRGDLTDLRENTNLCSVLSCDVMRYDADVSERQDDDK